MEGCKAMRSRKSKSTLRLIALLGLLASGSGCVTYSHHAIPADRLPPELKFCEKGCRVPVNLALLTQTPPRSYIIGPGDVLAIYIRGLLPPNVDDPAPVVQGNTTVQQVYYPPAGNVATPSIGVPLQVSDDGSLSLPVIGSIPVSGLTVQQAVDKISTAIINKEVVQKGREYVYISVVRRRVTRVVVVREEIQAPNPTIIARNASVLARRGSAQAVDLPAFEDDVLHALTASGGMPGSDALNEVWVLRREQLGDQTSEEVVAMAANGGDPVDFVSKTSAAATAKRIPLWTRNGESPSFTQEDVLLEEGDIVYLRARQQEVFYTGGLIIGAEIPLPRDHDIDVIEAVAIANASVGGPNGASGQVIQFGAGIGNIIPPTRAIILRKMPNGQQVAIRVDLIRAMKDPMQRVVIQPGDFINLYFKPGEQLVNASLNYVNVSFLIPGN